MNVWSLFSGVGGFDEAFRRAGANVTLQCELDPWRRRVLAAHFPDTRQAEDVRLVHGKPGDADVLCGGFPCQDLSVAGKRAGLDGDRSGLFFEFARIAGEIDLAGRGGWVFLENVPGLLSSNSGRDFGVVLETLADLGLAVAYRVLDSRFFGVPQRRRRVFIVGHSRADYARAVLFEPEGSAGSVEPSGAEGTEVAGTLGGGSGSRGWCDDFDRGGIHRLSGLGNGGPDDNDAQAGRLIPQTFDWQAGGTKDTSWGGKSRQWIEDKPGITRSLVKNKVLAVHHVASNAQAGRLIAETVGKKPRNQSDHDTLVVAAPLTSGTPPNSNQAGRRKEDDINLVAFHTTQDPITDVVSPAVSKGTKAGMGAIGDSDGAAVRRLTPRECERLQGFPDDWTAIDGLPEYAQAKGGSWRCKQGTPDSRRYAAMGDAVTVNTVEWIARRLVDVIG